MVVLQLLTKVLSFLNTSSLSSPSTPFVWWAFGWWWGRSNDDGDTGLKKIRRDRDSFDKFLFFSIRRASHLHQAPSFSLLNSRQIARPICSVNHSLKLRWKDAEAAVALSLFLKKFYFFMLLLPSLVGYISRNLWGQLYAVRQQAGLSWKWTLVWADYPSMQIYDANLCLGREKKQQHVTRWQQFYLQLKNGPFRINGRKQLAEKHKNWMYSSLIRITGSGHFRIK